MSNQNNTPVCRHCGNPLHAYEQGSKPARVNGEIVFTEVRILVECHDSTCPMIMQTFDSERYPSIDLTPYLEKAVKS